MSDWVSVTEAAVLAGVSERTVRRWIKRGRLTSARRGQALLVPVDSLAALGGRSDGPVADMADRSDNGSATEATELAALVRELKAELTQTTAAAAMWQERARTLAMQLEQTQRVLEAPKSHNAQEGASASNLTAEAPDPPAEPSDPPAKPPPPLAPDPLPPTTDGRRPKPNGSGWWRRLEAWLMAGTNVAAEPPPGRPEVGSSHAAVIGERSHRGEESHS